VLPNLTQANIDNSQEWNDLIDEFNLGEATREAR